MSTLFLIYKLTSPSGKSYIGRTYNLTKRLGEHSRKSSPCILLRNAIQKYGLENFKIEILLENLHLDEANILEAKLISEHNSLHPSGYNIQLGGTFHNQTPELREKISKTSLGRVSPNKGKLLSEETKHKMSIAKKGKRPNNAGKICKNRGIPLSEDRKKQLSESMRTKMTDEKRTNNSNAQKGKILSDHHKEKISSSLLGIKRPIVMCPHCGKEGAHNNMVRYHFNNCKLVQQ
jgi:group I intron endonuclease